ncbi:MAG: restriction endonuclease subunit S, partial [Shewanella xiamenensis]|nr:restriction endonuclease subunit S [Shewanella xiamenensis]
ANTNQALALIRPINSLVNPLYLLYFLQQREVVHFVNNATSQSAQPNINLKQIGDLEIRLPELAVQNKVVDILSSLDRKLVINTDINQNLESIAQAIFKSWFVDFDPVKAKMNGEQPEGMDAATASLFPEKLVESELGLIPEGWEVSTLSSLIQLTGGGTPKRSEETYWNGDIPWFSVRDVPSGSNVFVVDTDEKITELGLNKSSTKLLPKGTTIITARGTVGKLALVGTDMCMNQSCYGIRGKEVGDFYNYFNLNEAVSTLQRNTHGAVFDTITTKTFDTYSMPFGGVELANKFDSIVAPLLQKIEANVRQNIELSTLRDTLLPKLLSGEIELAEKQEN